MKPAYVIYPLHSFGFLDAGLFTDASNLPTSEALAREHGVAVTAQHRSLESVAQWLQQVHEWFGVEGNVPFELLHHWQRSRSGWLATNPLVVVRVYELSGGAYYENQHLLSDRLHVATAFLAGLSVRQPPTEPDENRRLFSTRSVNNWSTLDIGHYYVMNSVTDDKGFLTGEAVPMNIDAGYLAELSDLPVDLDMAHWSGTRDDARSLWQALNSVGDAQAATRFRRKPKNDAPARTARKMFESLDYFRRSLGSDRWYAVTSLGTAFEMLLTSHYEPGVTNRLRRRVQLLTNDATSADAVERLYHARSKLVHAGESPPEELDLATAQRAYLACFESLAPKLSSLRPEEGNPLREMTGDTLEEPRR